MIGWLGFHDTLALICAFILVLLCHRGVLAFVYRVARWDHRGEYTAQRDALERSARRHPSRWRP